MKLAIPTAALDQHLVVLGKTGSGKSSALRHIVEHLLAQKKRVCIVDPKGDWWGLKSSADGKGPGLPVIMFGDFKETKAADVPVNDRSGKHIAELVAGGNRPCVIGMRGWTQGGMARFWIDFASTLFARNSGELYLVGDEFHNFAPKQWKGKSEKESETGIALHWSNRLLSEGRGLGIVCLLASQRPQKVHNDSLTSCETLVAMRVIHAADRNAVQDWIDGNGDPEIGKQVMATLAKLERGEGWVWSPEIGFGPQRVKFPMFKTFDSFAPPQLQKRVSNKGWADVDLSAVKEKLATVIEEEKANDPAEMKKTIGELRRQLKAAETAKAAAAPPPPPAKTRTVEKLIVRDQQIQRLERLSEKFDGLLPKVCSAMALAEARAAELRKVGDELSAGVKMIDQAVRLAKAPAAAKVAPTSVPARLDAPVRAAVVTTVKPRRAEATAESNGELSSPEQRIIDGIAWLNSIGVDEPEDGTVAFVAGYSPTSTSYTNPRGALRSKGLIEYLQGDARRLTSQGRGLAVTPEEPPTVAEMHRKILDKLPTPEQRILKPLLQAYPKVLSNADLAAAADYTETSTSYTNPRGRLRTLGLIEYRDGGVAARSILFPGENDGQA